MCDDRHVGFMERGQCGWHKGFDLDHVQVEEAVKLLRCRLVLSNLAPQSILPTVRSSIMLARLLEAFNNAAIKSQQSLSQGSFSFKFTKISRELSNVEKWRSMAILVWFVNTCSCTLRLSY